MRSTVMLVVVLTLVCLISALALAFVNNLTEDRIAAQKLAAKLRAVEEALPRDDLQYDNNPSQDISSISEWKEKDGTAKEIYLGKRGGEIIGAAFTSVGSGYGGFITVMMGVAPDGKVTGIEIIEHLETPGLGANIESPKLFKNQFRGKHPPEGKLTVVKAGMAKEDNKDWEVEALTGATVSPRGVVQAVNDGLAMFRKYKDQILTSKGGTQ
ncbi:RnfABCDGE type electron transport complex subunit G [Candidatus Poribacteria bacterium]